jgi:hypothetical protein
MRRFGPWLLALGPLAVLLALQPALAGLQHLHDTGRADKAGDDGIPTIAPPREPRLQRAPDLQMGVAIMTEVLHTKHYSKDGVGGADIYCGACHHKSEGTDVKRGCPDCHVERAQGAMLSLQAAQHRTCLRCHLEVNNRPANFRGSTWRQSHLPINCFLCHEHEAEPVERWKGFGERFPMVPDRLSCLNW